jgi:hypothetical protein
MPFVKLDCGILDSTLWFERECREVFLTALLMAEPFELKEPTPQICVNSLALTGWIVPVGWYGFVSAAGVGIVYRAGVAQEVGIEALIRLGEPEKGSRSPEYDGRRLVRVEGGYIILNYIKYRERDYTMAERSRRYRQRIASRRDVTVSRRDITQAEVEAEVDQEQIQDHIEPSALVARFDEFWARYPKKVGKGGALKIWTRLNPSASALALMLSALESQKTWLAREQGKYTPNPATWLNQSRWLDSPPVVNPAGNVTLAPSEWVCPHDPPCGGRWACQNLQQIAAYKEQHR